MFKRILSKLRGPTATQSALFNFLDEARAASCHDLDSFQQIAQSSAAEKTEFLVELAALFLPERAELRKERNYLFRPAVMTLWNELCANELPVQPKQRLALLDALARGHVGRALEGFIGRDLDMHYEGGDVDQQVAAALTEIAKNRPDRISGTMIRLCPQLRNVLATSEEAADAHDSESRWRRFSRLRAVSPVEAWLDRTNHTDLGAWTLILEHARDASTGSRPTQRFARAMGELVVELGATEFLATMCDWLANAPVGPATKVKRTWIEFDDEQRAILRGLIWAAGPIADSAVVSELANFALRCFKKVPGEGPADTKLGNACVIALANAPGTSGVAALSALATRVRYASAKRRVDAALNAAARRTSVSREELEEQSVPTFGLDVNGRISKAIGTYTLTTALGANSVEMSWRNAKGKTLKSVPKPIRDNFAEELKEARAEKKRIAAIAAGQLGRLESMWMRRRTLPLETLRQHYLEHPLVGFYARRLVWSVEGDDGWTATLFRDGRFEALGQPVETSQGAHARLWHPLEMRSEEEIAVWRDWLAELAIAQPITQLYRDAYVASDDSDTDNRFVDHIISQQALREQCHRHGWRYQVQGYFDSENWPVLEIADLNLVVTFGAMPVLHHGDDALFEYLVTGAVQFERTSDAIGSALAPADVDPQLFSEIMRQIGSMVAASTVTTEPSFARFRAPDELERLWRRSAVGELSIAGLARADALADIIPRTTLRTAAAVEERWLMIHTDAASHRIHIGSGLVQEKSSGKQAQVRVGAKAKRAVETVLLPFEGDAMLGRILARAFELAAGK